MNPWFAWYLMRVFEDEVNGRRPPDPEIERLIERDVALKTAFASEFDDL